MRKLTLLTLASATLFFLAGCGGGAVPRGNAGLAGTVVDATDASPISGAHVCLVWMGRNAVCDDTDSSGAYSLQSLPAGQQKIRTEAAGHAALEQTVELVDGVTTTLHIASSPSLGSGELRIVLSWDENPRDIDSHLWAPSGGSYYEVYYGNQGSCSAAPWSCLDVDDTDSYGPETITIKQIQSGTYKYALHWYAGSGDWAHSGATVRVYDAHGLVKEYHAPADSSHGVNSWWYVFDLNGAHISDRNTAITDAPPEASGASLQQSIK